MHITLSWYMDPEVETQVDLIPWPSVGTSSGGFHRQSVGWRCARQSHRIQRELISSQQIRRSETAARCHGASLLFILGSCAEYARAYPSGRLFLEYRQDRSSKTDEKPQHS